MDQAHGPPMNHSRFLFQRKPSKGLMSSGEFGPSEGTEFTVTSMADWEGPELPTHWWQKSAHCRQKVCWWGMAFPRSPGRPCLIGGFSVVFIGGQKQTFLMGLPKDGGFPQTFRRSPCCRFIFCYLPWWPQKACACLQCAPWRIETRATHGSLVSIPWSA